MKRTVVPSLNSQKTASALIIDFALSLPGMFLDVLLVTFAGIALPNLSVGAVINFGAILLFRYSIVLVTGFVPR